MTDEWDRLEKDHERGRRAGHAMRWALGGFLLAVLGLEHDIPVIMVAGLVAGVYLTLVALLALPGRTVATLLFIFGLGWFFGSGDDA